MPTANPEGVFQELLNTFADESQLALGEGAVREFRNVYDLTVGRYLNCQPVDYWKESAFRKFAFFNARWMSRAVYDAVGDAPPTAADVHLAALKMVRYTHDRYCAKLPACPGGSPNPIQGEVCTTFRERFAEEIAALTEPLQVH